MDTSVDSLSSVTSFPDLSSIHQDNIQNAASTIQNLLSSLRQINADLSESREALPTHPFDRLKNEYSHPDSKPMSFENIEVPQDFCPIAALKDLEKITENTTRQIDQHFAALSGLDVNDHPHFGNAFASYVDGGFVLDKKAASDHLEFIDMIRQIPIEHIRARPDEFAKKIIASYIKINTK